MKVRSTGCKQCKQYFSKLFIEPQPRAPAGLRADTTIYLPKNAQFICTGCKQCLYLYYQ